MLGWNCELARCMVRLVLKSRSQASLFFTARKPRPFLQAESPDFFQFHVREIALQIRTDCRGENEHRGKGRLFRIKQGIRP